MTVTTERTERCFWINSSGDVMAAEYVGDEKVYDDYVRTSGPSELDWIAAVYEFCRPAEFLRFQHWLRLTTVAGEAHDFKASDGSSWCFLIYVCPHGTRLAWEPCAPVANTRLWDGLKALTAQHHGVFEEWETGNGLVSDIDVLDLHAEISFAADEHTPETLDQFCGLLAEQLADIFNAAGAT